MTNDTLTVDLRPLLDPKRWRASAELQELLKRPLARPTQLNDRLTEQNEKRGREQKRWRTENDEEHKQHCLAHRECSVLNWKVMGRSEIPEIDSDQHTEQNEHSEFGPAHDHGECSVVVVMNDWIARRSRRRFE